jgi:probable HAF family extracellular repeat protein
MTAPERTPIRRWRILALAAALLLAALVEAGPATAGAAEPPPVSCIADDPVDPLGPGFLLNRGEFTNINHPKATLETAPYGINNRGQIVGFSLDADQVRNGFLFKNGALTTIDHPLASSDTQAHDLNDRGQIAGLYERAAGQAVEARLGAGRSGSGPTRPGATGVARSPLTSWWTVSGAASVQ